MSHCDARVKVEVKHFLSQKIFNFFSKLVCSMFQDSGIILTQKNFFRLSDHSESGYRNVIPKAETPPYLSSEKAHSPCSDHMERGLDLGCLIAMRECQSRSKIFYSKSKNFQLFFKTCLLHVSGLWDDFTAKKFFPTFRPL